MTTPANDRRARRRARREGERGAGPAGGGRSPWLIPGLLAGVLIVAAALAIVLPGSARPSPGGASSLPPTTSPGASAATSAAASAASSAAASGEPVITGASLPDFQNPTGDPAVGRPAPEVHGTDFAGTQVAIANDGKPKVIIFIAHWCPHCQREVPLIQSWVSAGGVSAGVEIAVATSIDPARPNYPPDQWLDGEGWTVPTIADPSNTVASAYGLTAFPYWVFVGADGTVHARAIGELPTADIERAIASLTGG